MIGVAFSRLVFAYLMGLLGCSNIHSCRLVAFALGVVDGFALFYWKHYLPLW